MSNLASLYKSRLTALHHLNNILFHLVKGYLKKYETVVSQISCMLWFFLINTLYKKMLLLIDNVIYSYLTTATFLFLTFLIEFLIYVRFHLRLPSNRQENYRQDVVE